MGSGAEGCPGPASARAAGGCVLRGGGGGGRGAAVKGRVGVNLGVSSAASCWLLPRAAPVARAPGMLAVQAWTYWWVLPLGRAAAPRRCWPESQDGLQGSQAWCEVPCPPSPGRPCGLVSYVDVTEQPHLPASSLDLECCCQHLPQPGPKPSPSLRAALPEAPELTSRPCGSYPVTTGLGPLSKPGARALQYADVCGDVTLTSA